MMNSINDLFVGLPAGFFFYPNLIRIKHVVQRLTSLQIQADLIAMAIFSCCSMMYISYRHRLKGRKIGYKSSLKVINSPSFLLQKKEKRSIAARLEANRKDAERQQMHQFPTMRFTVDMDDPPTHVGINGKWMPIESDQLMLAGKEVGVASCQGRRNAMEDTEIAIETSFHVQDHLYSFHLFGVFDGHGGANASHFVKGHISCYLKQAFEAHNRFTLTDEGIFKALKECCVALDRDFSGIGGTTATIAVILNDHIWIANVGDSRALLVQDEGVAIQATEDAKPEMDKYKRKVEQLGGEVTYASDVNGAIWRVNKILAVARAIGDKIILGKSGQCCISPKPKITRFPLKDFKGGYLALACDGLFDVASTNQVGQAIDKMAEEGNSVEKICQKLVYHAIQAGSRDNVTVMVVKL